MHIPDSETVSKSRPERTFGLAPKLVKKRPVGRPRDLTEPAGGQYSLAVGGIMLSESEAPAIAAEVDLAMEALLIHSPGSLKEFEETFIERSKMVGAVESLRGIEGLEGALAELLPTGFLVSQSGEKKFEVPDPQFVEHVRRAICLLGQRDPLSLLILKKNQLRRGCSLEQALESLLSEYSKRGASYPY